jgi:hypothetical protein
MDIKVSRKEKRLLPGGPADVLMSSVFDVYPIFGNDPRAADIVEKEGLARLGEEALANLIMDVEILDDDKEERLDRAAWACIKQRGADPVDPEDGIQWAEALLGEIQVPVIILQQQSAVAEEGTGVHIAYDTVRSGGKNLLTFTLKLTG